MKNNRPNSPREILNQREEMLNEKHQQRLDEMLAATINHQESEVISDVSIKATDCLEKKEKVLEAKHQQRLVEMTQQVVSSLRAVNYLDQKELSLAQKYQQRLNKITTLALSNVSLYSLSLWVKQWLTPAPMMAVASVFAISVAVVFYFEQQGQLLPPDNLQVNAKLPTWVKDTDVPLELLENMDFYVWLSQQEHYAKTEDKLILAAAWHHKFATGKRHASRNLTKRFSGTTANFGEL